MRVWMSVLLGIALAAPGVSAGEMAPKAAPGTVALKGKPHLVRGAPRTEVFFSDLPTSYWIDQDRRHNAFQKAFLDGIRKSKPVGFTADVKTRQVIAVDGVQVEKPSYEDEETLDVESQK